MANNTIEITVNKYEEFMMAVAKIEAAKTYYISTEYPDEDIMAALLGIAKKQQEKELTLPKFITDKEV